MGFNADDLKEIIVSEPLEISDNNDAVVIKVQTYKDKPSLSIRKLYMDKAGHYQYGKQGITLPIEDADNPAIDILKEAIRMIEKFQKSEIGE